MQTLTLATPPSLPRVLASGAFLSPFKKGAPTDGRGTGTRLVLPGVRVDGARLTAYERVCGFAAGQDQALPVTYPHVLGFPLAMRLMAARDFPLPLLGLVHTSIEIGQRRGLGPDEEYELTVYIDGLAPHRRGTEAVVVTEARVGGEVVWESRSRYLARHRTEPAAAPRDRSAQPEREPLPAVAEWTLGGDVGRRYGAASGDRNPIHLYPLTARLFGFPRAIAHGMWTVARCLAQHGVPEAARVRAEFRAPVLLPGTVVYAAEGAAFELRGGGQGAGEDRIHVMGEVLSLVQAGA
ncbi:MaoC family dehydratase [Streptomyces sp. NPDC002577]